MAETKASPLSAADVEETFSPMFCYQCEQTMGGAGCTQAGRCGKSPRISYLQDVVVLGMKSLSLWVQKRKELVGLI